MFKILIITTEGCEGCNIAKRNIENAILQTSKPITIDTMDYHKVPVKIISKYKVKDYPAVLYFINDTCVSRSIGSYPVAVYLRWIDMYFK